MSSKDYPGYRVPGTGRWGGSSGRRPARYGHSGRDWEAWTGRRCPKSVVALRLGPPAAAKPRPLATRNSDDQSPECRAANGLPPSPRRSDRASEALEGTWATSARAAAARSAPRAALPLPSIPDRRSKQRGGACEWARWAFRPLVVAPPPPRGRGWRAAQGYGTSCNPSTGMEGHEAKPPGDGGAGGARTEFIGNGGQQLILEGLDPGGCPSEVPGPAGDPTSPTLGPRGSSGVYNVVNQGSLGFDGLGNLGPSEQGGMSRKDSSGDFAALHSESGSAGDESSAYLLILEAILESQIATHEDDEEGAGDSSSQGMFSPEIVDLDDAKHEERGCEFSEPVIFYGQGGAPGRGHCFFLDNCTDEELTTVRVVVPDVPGILSAATTAFESEGVSPLPAPLTHHQLPSRQNLAPASLPLQVWTLCTARWSSLRVYVPDGPTSSASSQQRKGKG